MIKRLFSFLSLTFLVTAAGTLSAAEDTFETLKIGSQTYTNVTILNKNKTAVFISYTGGLISFKVKDLGPEDLIRLGYAPPEPPKTSALTAKIGAFTANMRLAATNNFAQELKDRYHQLFKSSRTNPGTLLMLALGVVLLIHLFCSFCLRMICLKTKTEPGVMIWLPILQLIPMHRAAGISPALIFFYFIPLLGLFVFLYWSVKICQARGKSAGLVILLFIPLLNLFFLPYLAFSSAEGEDELTPSPIKMG